MANAPIYPPFVFVNGLLFPQMEASLPVNDLALLRGYGVFDFFLVKDGQPLFFEDHWARLQQSAAALHLRIPFSKEDALRMAGILHSKMPYPLAGVRITLTGGCSMDGFLPGEAANSLLTLQPVADFPDTLSPKGIGLMTHEYRRAVASIKSIDYLVGIMMQPVASQKGFQDILYVLDGKVSECPRSNVFAVTQQDMLITPNEGVLNGITRKRVLAHASNYMKVEERPVHVTDLLEAKEVFITSTTKGIWAVGNIDGRVIGEGKPGTFSQKLYSMLLKEMNDF
jgi:branched-subunit amino acid aminotransferase/4-amino-4-deoxychorismate lyase